MSGYSSLHLGDFEGNMYCGEMFAIERMIWILDSAFLLNNIHKRFE